MYDAFAVSHCADNICYAIGFSPGVRARVEAVGRVQIGDADAKRMSRVKMAHLLLLVLSIALQMVALSSSNFIRGRNLWVPFYAFWAGGVVDVCSPDEEGEALGARAGRMFLQSLLCFALWNVLFVIAF
jgi:hypothetical protein